MSQIIELHRSWVTYKKDRNLHMTLRFGQYWFNSCYNGKETLNEIFYEENDKKAYDLILALISK